MSSPLRRPFGRRGAWSWRRRASLGLSLFAAVALAAVVIGTAAAAPLISVPIAQSGQFELDGNAVTQAATPPPYDWDKVFAQCVTANKCGENPGSIDGALARTFLNDPINSPSDDIFTGGSSKDGLAISGWLWKMGAPQAKDDLEHAYASEYLKTYTANGTSEKHDLLFFGTDRFSNSGDSDVGFWFLQKKVAETGSGTGGGSPFSGNHTDGDLLVLSTFVNGGSQPQVAVYKWSCPSATTGSACDSTGTLVQVEPNANADCVATSGGGAATGPYCATTNAVSNATDPTTFTPSPWPYTEKASDNSSHVAANRFGPGTFFEGGVDLTAVGLDRDCFSTFLTETRSSQSTTATLSDVKLGNFTTCTASMTTTPSGPQGTNLNAVIPGTNITDLATVTGSGLATPPFPTSSTTAGDPGAPGTQVTFTLCGPDSSTTCSTVGTSNLSNTTTQGVSTATSPSVAPQAPGKYCFHASWGGDANYPGTINETNPTAECFTVAPLPTATVTTPVDGNGNPIGTPALGSSAFDHAVVTAYTDATLGTPTGAGGFPSGTVTFYICRPGQVTGTPGSEVCGPGNGTQVGSPVATTEVSGATPAHSQSQATSSPGVTLDTAGTWCFRAVYTPNSPAFVAAGSGDGSHTECFTVPPQPTTTVTTPQDGSGANLNTSSPTFTNTGGITAYDAVTVTGVAGAGNVTGSVAFWLCGPGQTDQVSNGQCSPAAGSLPFDTETLAPASGANPPKSTAKSTGVVLTKVGTYCFEAKYTPDTVNYTGSMDNSSTECFTLRDKSTTSTAQDWLPNDTATFSTAGGNPLNGAVAFTLYPDGDCNVSEASGGHPDSPLYVEPTINLASNTPSGVVEHTNNSSVKVTSTQAVSWLVAFTSSDPLVASSKHCETTSLALDNNPPQ